MFRGKKEKIFSLASKEVGTKRNIILWAAGLGIKNLEAMNIILLCKWWWKIAKNSDSPIRENLTKVRDYYHKGMIIVTKSGYKTAFSTDNWLDMEPMNITHPDLYEICEEKGYLG
jgi:hypothetical protein